MSAKKVKVKVKKKKLKIKTLLITLIILILLVILGINLVNLPIKNIYIVGNSILNDKTIINEADLTNYPPVIKTFFSNIEKKLLKNDYIKSVDIKRNIKRKITLSIEEYKPICIYKEKLILSSTASVDNIYNIDYVPYVINNMDPVYDKFVKKFTEVNTDVLLKISHIEYTPNDLDDERFLLYMTDSNYVYITLSKIDKINKYNSIIQKMENKKGIIYLDSGDYVEIKD